MFPSPRHPRRDGSEVPHSGSSDMGEWSVVATAVEVVIVVVAVDVGDIRIEKSRCAPCHRKGQVCCVFPHRCNTPFLEVRKKLNFLDSSGSRLGLVKG